MQTFSPYVIAHRGASFYAPENTLEAFQKAIEMNVKHIEFDCWLTQDQHIVVCHDAELSHTTNFSGNIKHLPLEVVKQADAGHGFAAKKIQAKIPTLREVLIWSKDKEATLFIELKDSDLKIAKLAVDLLLEFDQLDKSILISFHSPLIEWIAKTYSQVQVGFSEGSCLNGLLEKAERYKALGVMVKHSLLNQEFVQEAQRKNLKVWIFTIKSPKELSQCLKYPIEGYCADQPDLKLSTL